ncbi:alpha/beta fold hydrolase [Haloferax profundi]|uniref:Carboxylesterase n=1 Tax=Haloferax profundi TaxID=1544718 RepID=A0A0W1SMP2_9EURY|nr:alpha/beta hydrolase [Haloferax profundi]KTG27535.1 carboxylesterase [Haloferax profundi]
MDAATVEHNGRTTAYRYRDAGGEGPTVLCIHGSGGSHAVWRGQFRLAGDYPVAAVDLSGHGESDDVDAEPGYETLSAYVDDVVAVAEETDASVLVGNSLGGAVVMTLALERDLDLDALVLAGTGAKLAVLDDLLNWLDDDFDQAVSFLHEDDKLFHTDDGRLVEGSKEAMYDAGQAVTRRDFRSCHTFDVRDQLGEITVPTLALVGEYDRLTPPSYHEFLTEEMPNCEMATIEDAAHLAMLEQPGAFNAAVKSFLDRRVE